jgi:RelE-like HigB toxin of type II HigAB toxin-antitoxin system
LLASRFAICGYCIGHGPSQMRVPPGNRLEALKGDQTGGYSIRVNDQYRICSHWEDGDAYDVESTDTTASQIGREVLPRAS